MTGADAAYPGDSVLIIDDEEAVLETLSVTLSGFGITNLRCCQDSREVEALLSQQRFSVVILDLYMPYISGQKLLPIVLQDYPETPVIVVTGSNEIETAVECMRSGTFDYLVKPIDIPRLVTSVRHAIENREIKSENLLLKDHLLSDTIKRPQAFSSIITQSSSMRLIFQYVEAIAKTSLPILITGETGVGKELLAIAVHIASERSGNFVAVNVAGLDDTLFADTLFGHKKGAFTGATNDRGGMTGKASDGTLFLDEIGDLSIESQIKLLRLLQEKEYYALGTDIPLSTNARFIFATNHDLASESKNGLFRKDLYYRLHSHHIHVPPLRERKEDIPCLVDHFLEKAFSEIGKNKVKPPKELFTLLRVYDFPGNIRELEGLIFDAVVWHESGILSLTHIKKALGVQEFELADVAQGQENTDDEASTPFSSLKNLPTVKQAVDLLIEESLRRAEGNQTIAAQILGMTRAALNKRLNRTTRRS